MLEDGLSFPMPQTPLLPSPPRISCTTYAFTVYLMHELMKYNVRPHPSEMPLCDDSATSTRQSCTSVNPAYSRMLCASHMYAGKPSDLEALSDAVKSENHRLYAVEAQMRFVSIPIGVSAKLRFRKQGTARAPSSN